MARTKGAKNKKSGSPMKKVVGAPKAIAHSVTRAGSSMKKNATAENITKIATGVAIAAGAVAAGAALSNSRNRDKLARGAKNLASKAGDLVDEAPQYLSYGQDVRAPKRNNQGAKRKSR